jgi:hypothetical protein
MIKLKKEVNKSELMRDVNIYAEKKYGNSAAGISKIWAFTDGAAYLFDLLRLPVVSGSLSKQTDGLSLIPDMARFIKDVLDNYDTMHDDVKKNILYNIYRGLEDCGNDR